MIDNIFKTRKMDLIYPNRDEPAFAAERSLVPSVASAGSRRGSVSSTSSVKNCQCLVLQENCKVYKEIIAELTKRLRKLDPQFDALTDDDISRITAKWDTEKTA